MKIFLFILRSLFGGIALSTILYIIMSIKVHKQKEGLFWWTYFIFGFSFTLFILSCIMFGW
jgi:hypothetical protein